MIRYMEIDVAKLQNLTVCDDIDATYPMNPCAPGAQGQYAYFVLNDTRPIRMFLYEMKVFGAIKGSKYI